MQGLLSICRGDAELISDGGGEATAARRPDSGCGRDCPVLRWGSSARRRQEGGRSGSRSMGSRGWLLLVGTAMVGSLCLRCGRGADSRDLCHPEPGQAGAGFDWRVDGREWAVDTRHPPTHRGPGAPWWGVQRGNALAPPRRLTVESPSKGGGVKRGQRCHRMPPPTPPGLQSKRCGEGALIACSPKRSSVACNGSPHRGGLSGGRGETPLTEWPWHVAGLSDRSCASKDAV